MSKIRKVLSGFLLIALIFTAGIYLGGKAFYSYTNKNELSTLQQFAVEVIKAPSNAKAIIKDPHKILYPHLADLPEAPTFEFYNPFQQAVPVPLNLYIGLFDDQDNSFKLFFLDMDKQDTLKSWEMDYEELASKYEQWVDTNKSKYPFVDYAIERKNLAHKPIKQVIHLPDNSLIFTISNVGVPIMKMDAEGNLLWMHEKLGHHSTEMDADSLIWFCSLAACDTCRYYVGEIAQMNTDGKVLFTKTLASIFQDNPNHKPIQNWQDYHLLNYLTRRETVDFYHLNDIQPVLRDGPYWKEGDLFLSCRNISTVFLYRPSENKIIWSKKGPWTFQHDVEILNDSTITIFDNNYTMGESYFLGGRKQKYPESLTLEYDENQSRIIAYDFGKDTLYTLFDSMIDEYGIYTATQGRFKWFKEQEVAYLEDTESSVFYFFDTKEGKTYPCAVPASVDGKLHFMQWNTPVPGN